MVAMTHDWLNLSWKMLMVRGGLAIIFGILAMAWPIETAIALAILFGVWALVDGIGSFAQAFEKGTPTSARILLLVMGVVALIVAFFAIFSPAVAAVTLTWILGIWLIVRGAFEVFAAFSATRDAPRWLLLVTAAVDVILGVLFVANPGSSVVAIAWVLGLVAIVWGIAFVATGFIVRHGEHGAEAAPPVAGAPA
jgi:uncharacterized membrane protein HdeD (DUF308 family)